MAYKFAAIKVSQLVMDHVHNPRHNAVEDEPAAIALLYRPEKVLGLAKHIAKHGLNPMERIALIPHPNLPKLFIALEGNRRVCALKLLRDPMRGPDSKAQKELKAVVDAAEAIPLTVEAVVFDQRPSAREWLRIKHRATADGVGTRHWNPTQNGKFDSQETGVPNPNLQSIALLDYAEQTGLVGSEDRPKISLTTMTRYLSTPAVRAALGLVNGRDLMRNAPPDEFDRALSRFLRDLLPRTDGCSPMTMRRRSRRCTRAYLSIKSS